MATKQTEAKAKATKKTATRKRKTAPAAAYEHIAVRAYFLHLAEGGDPLENWLRAEQELLAA
jgi:DUF2934 family protein